MSPRNLSGAEHPQLSTPTFQQIRTTRHALPDVACTATSLGRNLLHRTLRSPARCRTLTTATTACDYASPSLAALDSTSGIHVDSPVASSAMQIMRVPVQSAPPHLQMHLPDMSHHGDGNMNPRHVATLGAHGNTKQQEKKKGWRRYGSGAICIVFVTLGAATCCLRHCDALSEGGRYQWHFQHDAIVRTCLSTLQPDHSHHWWTLGSSVM